MVLLTQRTKNTNSVASVPSAIGLSATAAVLAVENPKRIFFHSNNSDSNQGYWIRLYPAAQDNLKRGIFVSGRNGPKPWWEMKSDNLYTGEISAVADVGTPNACTTEY